MATTAIEWTEATWNPVTGCDRVSPGCDNCYALTLAKRLKAMGSPRYQRDGDPATSGPGFGLTLHEDKVDEPLRWKRPRMVFVNSMSDLFHESIPDDFIFRVFDVMAVADQHTFQILTKRPRRALDVLGQGVLPPNVWLGVSIESWRFNWRAEVLRRISAQVRFVSAEPLLDTLYPEGKPARRLRLFGIDWVIVGGESGPGFRLMEPRWAREVRDHCAAANKAFFFKQWGGRTPKSGGRELDGREWNEMPT